MCSFSIHGICFGKSGSNFILLYFMKCLSVLGGVPEKKICFDPNAQLQVLSLETSIVR